LPCGLAKLAQKAAPEPDGITLTSAHTAAGMVMGTAAYVAPEQVRGEAAYARADIFALGTVLYEMLSGQRAFRRDTAAETENWWTLVTMLRLFAAKTGVGGLS